MSPQIKIDDPRVLKAREQWEEGSRACTRKVLCSFADLLELAQSTLTYKEIGERLGITPQAWVQLYDRYFVEALGPRPCRMCVPPTLREAQAYRALDRGESEAYRKMLDQPGFSEIMRSARKYRFLVKFIPKKPKVRNGRSNGRKITYLTTTVMISEQRWGVLVYRKPFYPKSTEDDQKQEAFIQASILRSRLSRLAGFIVCYAPPRQKKRVYVFPREHLERLFESNKESARTVLYIPLRKRRRLRRPNNARLAYDEYRDAWHFASTEAQRTRS